jgi:hypothetical protein
MVKAFDDWMRKMSRLKDSTHCCYTSNMLIFFRCCVKTSAQEHASDANILLFNPNALLGTEKQINI